MGSALGPRCLSARRAVCGDFWQCRPVQEMRCAYRTVLHGAARGVLRNPRGLPRSTGLRAARPSVKPTPRLAADESACPIVLAKQVPPMSTLGCDRPQCTAHRFRLIASLALPWLPGPAGVLPDLHRQERISQHVHCNHHFMLSFIYDAV